MDNERTKSRYGVKTSGTEEHLYTDILTVEKKVKMIMKQNVMSRQRNKSATKVYYDLYYETPHVGVKTNL